MFIIKAGMTPSLRHFLFIVALLVSLTAGRAVTLTGEEQQLANLLTTASGQQRNKGAMHLDERLVMVARARAMDMAKRDYFNHVNPDGNGPNFLVRTAGYALPASYSTDRKANNIESIGGGYMSAQECWSELLKSSPHRTHLLAQESFYRDQTSYGIGHYYDPNTTYWHYWVIITAPPAPVSALTIASPVAGAKVTTETLSVRGSVSGGAMFSALQLRLDTPAGEGTWMNLSLPTAAGVGQWTATVSGLLPGGNTIRVRTLDAKGAVARTSASAVRFVVLKPLTVSVDGAGKVTEGFAGTTNREVGVSYKISALPSAGFIFNRWEGLPETAGRDIHRATQTFVMAEGLALTAHFIANPFPALAANYGGLVGADGGAFGESGGIFVRVNAEGTFSGRLVFAGKRYAVLGRFNSIGEATVSIPRDGAPALSLAMHLDMSGTTQSISGTLSDGTAAFDFHAGQSVATEAVKFTTRIEPDIASAETQQGYGYAMVTIKADGVARVSGAMADGQLFSGGTYLTGTGSLPLYIRLADGKSVLRGNLQITDENMDGALHYETVEGGSVHQTAGARYVPPAAGAPCVQFGEANAGELTLAGGGLDNDVSQALAVESDGRITLAAPAPAGWKLRVNPVNGRYSGKFTHPSGGVRKLSGLVNQEDGTGFGFFLGANQSGAATLGVR